MARNKAPYASIFHLYALIRLYSHSYGINPSLDAGIDPNADKNYIDALSNQLIRDFIVSSGSRHLTNKLRGYPYQANVAECNEGIDEDRLDLLSQIVIDRYPEKIKIKKPTSSPWLDFQQNLFIVPEYLKDYQKHKYLKYLRPEEQHALKGFVERRLNELDFGINEINTYCVHLVNRDYNSTITAILQIDKKKSISTYTYYTKGHTGWEQHTVQRSDRLGGFFHICNNSLFINQVEENDEKKQVHASLILALKDVSFYNQNFIGGILASSAENASIPMCAKIILEKKHTYREAFETATNPASRLDDIDIEVLNGRIEVREGNLGSVEKFRTHNIAKLVKKIAGAYVFGFLRKPTFPETESAEFSKGVCYIDKKGIMRWQILESGEIKGRVLTDTNHGHDAICFEDFYKDGHDEYKYQYLLKIKGNILDGSYHGFDDLLPRSGAIAYVRKPEFNSFEEISSAIPCKYIPLDTASEKEDVDIAKILMKNDYWVLPKTKKSSRAT